MKVKSKKVSKVIISIKMSEDEASELKGLLNHAKLNETSETFDNLYELLTHGGIDYDPIVYHKVCEVIKWH